MSSIKISKKNLFYNLDIISKKVQGASKVFAVLKDNAYGHGLIQIAALVSQYGIKKAVVKNSVEANIIKEYFDDIIILSQIKEYENNPKYSYTINSIDRLKTIKNINIELKIDTGMYRNGINKDEINEALEIIKSNNINLKGVMTHFRSADELSSELFWQQKQWQEIKSIIISKAKEQGVNTPRFHSQNSSATFRLNSHDDFVRVGLAMYGYTQNAPTLYSPQLKPVLSLWANKISQRAIKTQNRVGYSGDGRVQQDTLISTYDIGYGDGFYRLLPFHKYILPNGKKIIGKISMDSFICEGDDEEICLMNNAKYLGEIYNTFSYDVLVKLSSNLDRVIL